MVNLDMRVFESFSFKDVIGEVPPLQPELVKKIELETQSLVECLKDKNQKELEVILAEQNKIRLGLDRLWGAKALSQSKMKIFAEFLTKYVDAIESRMAQT